MEKKTIYYQNPLTDDFAVNPTKKYQISDDFRYIHKNIFFRFFGFLIYHAIAIPLFFFILKIKYHVKVYNKKAVKKLKDTGFFVYMNHTQNIIDAFLNQTLVFKRKGHIIASNDVYSLKGLNTLVNMLGCMPTPNNMIQSKKLFDAASYFTNKKNAIVILPEAHIWPYYNDIRPFLDTGFLLPCALNKPMIVSTVVYRARKNEKKHPYISLYVSDPIYPKAGIPMKENQQYLRDEAYRIMKEAVKEHNSYEWIRYVQKDSNENNE